MSQAFHTFGCPVLVLHHQLHNNKTLPKFDPRTQCGVFLGWSKEHARSVALVLNPKTDHISMQYHVIFDNNFESIPITNKTKEIEQWTTIHKRNLKGVTPIKTEFCSYQDFLKEPTSHEKDINHKGPISDMSSGERPQKQREKETTLSPRLLAQKEDSGTSLSSSSSVLSLLSSTGCEESVDALDNSSDSEERLSMREFPSHCSTQL